MSRCFHERDQCEVCGSKDIHREYKVFSDGSKVFEKLNVDELPDIYIYKCKRCDFHFSSPIINEELLADYYTDMDSEYYDERERDIQITPNSTTVVLDLISKYQSSGNVLEIGSGRGELLNTLSQKNYACYGLEPSPSASEYSKREYGLNVKSQLVNDSNAFGVLYDVIILVDVIEHIASPADLLRKLKAFLKDNGIIIFTTGDINSLNARVLKSMWSYFGSYEHLSFFNETSISRLSKDLSFDILCYRRFSYDGSYLNNLLRLMGNIIVVPCKNIVKLMLNMFGKKKYEVSVGRLSNDHIAVVLRKK